MCSLRKAWLLFFVIASQFFTHAYAAIYQCDKEGKAVFADVPCNGRGDQPAVVLRQTTVLAHKDRPVGQEKTFSDQRSRPQVFIIQDSYTEARNARLSRPAVRDKKTIKKIKAPRKKSKK